MSEITHLKKMLRVIPLPLGKGTKPDFACFRLKDVDRVIKPTDKEGFCQSAQCPLINYCSRMLENQNGFCLECVAQDYCTKRGTNPDVGVILCFDGIDVDTKTQALLLKQYKKLNPDLNPDFFTRSMILPSTIAGLASCLEREPDQYPLVRSVTDDYIGPAY